MVQKNPPTVKLPNVRTPIRAYHPANAPHVTACFTYRCPDGRIVARSERRVSGILRTPPAIAWDAGVVDALERDGVSTLEVSIAETSMTYQATIDTLRQHCTYAHRYGRQAILSVRYWTVTSDNDAPALAQEPKTLKVPAADAHLPLFGGA